MAPGRSGESNPGHIARGECSHHYAIAAPPVFLRRDKKIPLSVVFTVTVNLRIYCPLVLEGCNKLRKSSLCKKCMEIGM